MSIFYFISFSLLEYTYYCYGNVCYDVNKTGKRRRKKKKKREKTRFPFIIMKSILEENTVCWHAINTREFSKFNNPPQNKDSYANNPILLRMFLNQFQSFFYFWMGRPNEILFDLKKMNLIFFVNKNCVNKLQTFKKSKKKRQNSIKKMNIRIVLFFTIFNFFALCNKTKKVNKFIVLKYFIQISKLEKNI